MFVGSPHTMQTWDHVIFQFANFNNMPFCWLVSLSICHLVNLPLGQLTIWSTCHLVNLPFGQLAIWSACHFVNLPFFQLTIWPTYHLVNLPFGQLTIWSTYHLVNLPFCQLAIWSTCHFVNLPFYQPKQTCSLWQTRTLLDQGNFDSFCLAFSATICCLKIVQHSDPMFYFMKEHLYEVKKEKKRDILLPYDTKAKLLQLIIIGKFFSSLGHGL